MSRTNVGAIVAAVVGGVALSFGVAGWCFVSRKRKHAPHVEEGARSPGLKERPAGWIPELKSAFSPDEKSIRGFDRIREALGRRGVKKSDQSILPVYQVSLPPGSTESIGRPPPVAPSHVPRYPSMLERGYSKRPHPPPPPLQGYSDLSRAPSLTDSLRSAEGGDRASRRRVQIPPRVLLVPPPGRPLPGFAGSRSAGLRPPKSPGRRRSWLSRHPFKHPFIPFRNADNSLKFPPGSPLYPGQYQPSREHLEARTRSPRIEATSPLARSMSTREVTRREPVRRQPVPLFEDDGGTSKQARLVEALQSAGTDGHRTPIPVTATWTPVPNTTPRTAVPNTAYRTPVYPNTSRHPPMSSRHPPPDVPNSAYI